MSELTCLHGRPAGAVCPHCEGLIQKEGPMVREYRENDPAFLLHVLRDARRRNDARRVLNACELLVLGARCTYYNHDSGLTELGDDCGCAQAGHPGYEHPPEDAPGVRDALRWALDLLAELPSGHWTGNVMAIATRIANLARMLPNPQPMVKDECGRCLGTGFMPELDGSNMDSGECTACDGRGSVNCADDPTPTHALRLYVDALMLAKGDGWWEWLKDHAEALPRVRPGESWLFLGDTDPYRHAEYGDKHRHTAALMPDGTIECGPICPPLPEVT